MSDQARSYTIDHSPYSGSGYLIHYMMATIANPTHDWRLFVGDTKLAQMCRVSVRTLQRQKAQMIEDGFLEELPVTSAPGRVKEYRFLMPTGDNLASVTGDNLASVDLERATPSAVTGDTQRGNGRQMAQSDLSIEPRNQGTNTSRHSSLVAVENHPFDDFWELYPRRGGKREGKAKAVAVWGRMSAQERALAMVAIPHYAEACYNPTMIVGTRDAHRWLRDKEWGEWQTPATPDPARRRDPLSRGRPTGSQLIRQLKDLDPVRFNEGASPPVLEPPPARRDADG